MGKDFFDGLGTAISRTARELGGKAENLYESQKMKNRIAGEERQIQKIMAEIGRIIYKRYLDGAPLEDAQRILCEQIDQRMDKIADYKEGLAGVRGRKICPSCGSSVEGNASFCPHCGAACTVREAEEDAGDVVEAAAEEAEHTEETKQSEDAGHTEDEDGSDEREEQAEAAENAGSCEEEETAK